MKEYTVATGWNWSEFEARCSELLKEGWTPQGGAAVSHNTNLHQHAHDMDILFAQAFVR